MPDENRVDSGTRTVIDAEVAHVFVSSEEVTFLLIYHQLLQDKNARYTHCKSP